MNDYQVMLLFAVHSLAMLATHAIFLKFYLHIPFDMLQTITKTKAACTCETVGEFFMDMQISLFSVIARMGCPHEIV